MYSAFYRAVLFPAIEKYNGTSIQRHLSGLNKSQWWSKEQIGEMQNAKLRALIRHAYENVPYYRRLLSRQGLTAEDIRTRDDLRKIPVLTKDLIRKNLPDLLARNIPPAQRMETRSSGSTGEPVVYYLDKASYSAGWASTFRCWGWAGYQIGDPYVKFSAEPRTTAIKKIQDTLMNSYFINASEITEDTLNNTLSSIRKFEPRIIRSYPTFLYAASKLMEKNGVVSYGAALTTTGSTLYPHYRKTIERQFNSRIFDAYGGEGTSIAFECEEHSGHHISDEDVVVEFLRQDESAAPGEPSRIIFTNLNNYAMPFIRYDIQDIGSYSDEICQCGRNLTLMSSLEGRDSDILKTRSGKFITVHFFGVLFRKFPGIDQFQIIQDRIDRICIKIVKNDRFSDIELEKIRTELRHEVGEDMIIDIKIVSSIPLSGRSQKRRYLISHVPLY